jgi:hypothetical protein
MSSPGGEEPGMLYNDFTDFTATGQQVLVQILTGKYQHE